MIPRFRSYTTSFKEYLYSSFEHKYNLSSCWVRARLNLNQYCYSMTSFPNTTTQYRQKVRIKQRKQRKNLQARRKTGKAAEYWRRKLAEKLNLKILSLPFSSSVNIQLPSLCISCIRYTTRSSFSQECSRN